MPGELPIQDLRRARPLREAPLQPLLARSEELARRWAIALILARPLELIGEVPLEDLAREAPGLLAQAVRALQSEAELERLTGSEADTDGERSAPALRIAVLAGSRSAGALVEAVDALRGVLWKEGLEELGWPEEASCSVEQTAALAERLAYVCATMLVAALRGPLNGAVAGELEYEQIDAACGAEAFDPDRARTRVTSRTPAGPRRGRQPAVLVDELLAGARPQSAYAQRPQRPGHAQRNPEWQRAGHAQQSRHARQRRHVAQPGDSGESQRPRPHPWDVPLEAASPGGSRAQASQAPDAGVENARGPVMRVRRRTSSAADERA